jgi:hypothetical protein
VYTLLSYCTVLFSKTLQQDLASFDDVIKEQKKQDPAIRNSAGLSPLVDKFRVAYIVPGIYSLTQRYLAHYACAKKAWQ